MSSKLKLVLSTAIAAGLAACSSGSSSPTSALYSSDVGTAADALAAGKTLQTNSKSSSKMMLIDYNNNTTQLVDAADVSLKKNDQGGVTLTVNGVEQVFASADVTSDGYGYVINDKTNNKFVGLWTFSAASAADAVNGTNSFGQYAQAWEFKTNQLANGPDQENGGFVVLGTETKPSYVADTSLPTAHYSGYATFKTNPASGYVDFNTSTAKTNGDVSMTANFGAGTVDGTITNITNGPADGSVAPSSVAGTITMDTSTISGNGYSGSLSADSTFLADTGITSFSGSYSGTFYGPNAEETGGVMSVTSTDSGGDSNTRGFFIAKQPTP